MSKQSTRAGVKTKAKPEKPSKPRKDFPLFPHDGRQWAKKVRGKMHYFGSWDDPQAALEKWLHEKDDLIAGRTPRPYEPDSLTVKQLCDLFLESRERRVESGEMAQQTYDNYLATAKEVAVYLGRSAAVEHLRPSDFAKLRSKLSKGRNLKSLEGHIARTRAIFNYADKNGLIERSLRKLWGTEFAKPSATAITKLSNETERTYTPAEVRKLLDLAGVQVKAMILLGINGGFGNTDIALIREENIDFNNGWISLPRHKTGKPRRCPLWTETLTALRAVLDKRPTPKDPASDGLVFITKYGKSWLPIKADNPLSKEFAKLRTKAKIPARGKSFYTLRHCFQTVGDETLDFVAVQCLMGHAPKSISDTYRGKFADKRSREVVNHVRGWLYPLVRIEAVDGGEK